MQNDCKIIPADRVEVMCPGLFESSLGKLYYGSDSVLS